MKNAIQLVLCAALAAASAGCFGYERRSSLNGPSAAGLSTLMGSWTSSSLIPSPSACSNFRWTVSEQTATTARGSFSATCTGDLQLSGTAEGSLSGNTVRWSAQGTATAPGLTSCNISLAGTAEIQVDSVRIPYTGNTCLGPVSGTEVLRRN